MDKDELAHKHYGSSYDSLSAWGKRKIDRIVLSESAPSYSATLPDRREEVSLRQRLAKTEAALEDALQENEDLLQENDHLRALIAKMGNPDV